MLQDTPNNFRAKTLGMLFPELELSSPICDLVVKEVVQDSREVVDGCAFIALQGARVNGRDFIEDAINGGANVILVEATSTQAAGQIVELSGKVILAVDKLGEKISALADSCFESPSKKITMIGVTGTNGKSTCVSLIAQLHNILGGKAASIGTVGLEFNGENVASFGMTTPDAVTCQKNLAVLVDKGADLVAMEVSSHGIAQHRVAAIDFDVAVFTNLTHDHLDYHGSIEAYGAMKQKLFEYEDLKFGVINLDDAYASSMLFAAKSSAKIYCYSLLHFVAEFYGSNLEYSTEGVEFLLTSPWGTRQVKSPLYGQFNVYNLLAAISAVCASGADFNSVVDAVPKLLPVTGRMQKCGVESDIYVLVDYAHTPDALEKAIQACRVHTSGSLWVVFGCGGDRDTAKRPIMAKVVESLADKIIITSDNPRTEDPRAIIDDVCSGFVSEKHCIQLDRKLAIELAIEQAQPGDTVLLAGKGHEQYQIVGERKVEFCDMATAQQALLARKNSFRGVAL